MLKADRVLSTPPTNTSVDTTRRRFLSQAAAATAAGAAIGATLPLPVAAQQSEGVLDPILAAIEAHKAARAGLIATVSRYARFERELQANGRLQTKKRGNDELREEEEIEAALDQASDAEREAACDLLNIRPTTFAGVIALLSHARDNDTDGKGWPDRLVELDGEAEDASDGVRGARSWQYFLIASLIEILPEIMSGVTS